MSQSALMAVTQLPQRLTETVVVPCEHGVHLRVAARIVALTKRFHATMWMTCGNRSAKASSVLGLLELGATQGTPLLVGAQGSDAPQALAELVALFTRGRCGEPLAAEEREIAGPARIPPP